MCVTFHQTTIPNLATYISYRYQLLWISLCLHDVVINKLSFIIIHNYKLLLTLVGNEIWNWKIMILGEKVTFFIIVVIKVQCCCFTGVRKNRNILHMGINQTALVIFEIHKCIVLQMCHNTTKYTQIFIHENFCWK